MELQKLEVKFINSLQTWFPQHEYIFVDGTLLGDPFYAYFLLFPFLFCLNRELATLVIWTAAVSDYCNFMLKWIFLGDRPYWWVGEYEVGVNLKQYFITCEPGPGMPSGHCMVTGAVWFVIIKYITTVYPRRSGFSVFLWVIYSIFMIFIGITRMFVAAHFPHQVVFGIIGGVIVGYTMEKYLVVEKLRPKHYYVCALGAMTAALSIYYFIYFLGLDLQYTVALAKKHCAKEHWLHMGTIPLNIVMKLGGFFLALGLTSRLEDRVTWRATSPVHLKLVVGMFNALTSLMLSSIRFNVSSTFLQLIMSMFHSIIIAYAISYLVPLSLFDLFNRIL